MKGRPKFITESLKKTDEEKEKKMEKSDKVDNSVAIPTEAPAESADSAKPEQIDMASKTAKLKTPNGSQSENSHCASNSNVAYLGSESEVISVEIIPTVSSLNSSEDPESKPFVEFQDVYRSRKLRADEVEDPKSGLKKRFPKDCTNFAAMQRLRTSVSGNPDVEAVVEGGVLQNASDKIANVKKGNRLFWTQEMDNALLEVPNIAYLMLRALVIINHFCLSFMSEYFRPEVRIIIGSWLRTSSRKSPGYQ